MRWRVPVSPATLTRSVAGSTESPSGTAGEAVPEGDSEAALEWLETTTAHIWRTWGSRYPTGKDWLATE